MRQTNRIREGDRSPGVPLPERMRRTGYALLNLLFPPKCPLCGTVLPSPGFCAPCMERLPWTGEGDGVRILPNGLRCVGPLRYDGLARTVILGMKFRGRASFADPLGRLVAQCAAERLSGEFDTVAWSPVSAERKRQRGYDQSELLAASVCRLWGFRPVRLLRKIRDTTPQSGLHSYAERRANASHAYGPAEGASIRGRRVLLVDDVCTSGETLRVCGSVLLSHGAASVVCAVAAIAGEQEPPPD